MDPATDYWQDTIAADVGRAQKAGNTSGVYIDQIASMYASSCYSHGHSGGGSKWADGNRATLEKAVKAVGPGKVVISESNAEAYLVGACIMRRVASHHNSTQREIFLVHWDHL